MTFENGYMPIIEKCAQKIDEIINARKWKDDEFVTSLFRIYHQALYSQIYSILIPVNTHETEMQIRELIQKYVIGYCNKKTKDVYPGALNLVKSKIMQIKEKNNIAQNYVESYLALYDDFLALASFRSYKHFCFYMQSVFGFTLWEDNERAFSGYWHYSEKMILDGSVVFLEKQLPTGTGKSLSDCFAHAWTFGVDLNADIFKVCGNDKFTDDCFNNVIKIMISPKYAKVFPYYARFKCDKNNMFSFCSVKDLKFAITGAGKSTSLRICTKLAETSGIRAKYLYIDDICQSDDTPALMKRDINKFNKEWFRRNYDLHNFYVVASGTSYSTFDILSYLKNKFHYIMAKNSPINEFTKVSLSNAIIRDGVAVFVSVPALDKNDESVFPKIRDSESLKKMREEDYRTFQAMEQQRPLPPDGSPFYYTKLKEYDYLPQIGEQGRTSVCVAALDTKRRGKDYLSMPILFEAEDPKGILDKVYYVVDWVYDDRPMKDLIPVICSKIILHNITRLYAERNTEEMISDLLTSELEKRGYTNCIIEDVYSTEPKDKRIMNSEADIKSKIIFPRFGMYSNISDIGKALNDLYCYVYSGKVLHDDSPDSLALFCKRFISNNTLQYASFETFKR